jgi:hypothetical protein
MSWTATRALARLLAMTVVVAVTLPLMACVPDDGRLPADPDSELGLPALIGLDPILKPETRVLESSETDQLDALQILNPEVCLVEDEDRETCRFRLGFAVLPAGLVVGAVVAAGVTSATPQGLLVRVTDIDGLVVDATEASLGDALEQGEFLVEREFGAADVVDSELATGVSAIDPGALSPSAGGGAPGRPSAGGDALQPGMGLAFNYKVDTELVTGVRATGEVGFDVGCGAYGGLTWKKVWGVPVYPNGVYFEAKCGVTQVGSITLTASAGVSIDKHVTLAVVNLSAITFFVGPLPVVLIPQITVSIDASGTLAASMSVGASEHFGAIVGLTYSDGFHLIKKFDSKFERNVTTGSARLSVTGGVSLTQGLMLYGIVGPRLTESLYLDLQGKPPGEKPVWCLTGGLKASASLHVDLGVKSLTWGPGELFNERKQLGCAPNTKPTVTVNSPYDGATVFPGNGGLALGFSGQAFDEEDGILPITWSSDIDGALGSTQPGVILPIGDLTVGTHAITAKTTDRDGASGATTFRLVVADGTPTVGFVAKNSSGAWKPVTTLSGSKGDLAYVRLAPKSPDPLIIPSCKNVTWTSTLVVKSLGNCDFSIALAQQGTFAVTATLSDDDGRTANATLTAEVGPAPSVVTPQISPITAVTVATTYFPSTSFPDQTGYLYPGQQLVLNVDYINATASGTRVKYAWAVQTTRTGEAPGPWEALGSPDAATLSGSERSFTSSSASNRAYTYVFRVQIRDATTGSLITTHTFTANYQGPPA